MRPLPKWWRRPNKQRPTAGLEIVLTGVNIGDFGRSTGENFSQLVHALDQVEGIKRYRISSIEPNLLTDEIVDSCAHSRAFMSPLPHSPSKR